MYQGFVYAGIKNKISLIHIIRVMIEKSPYPITEKEPLYLVLYLLYLAYLVGLHRISDFFNIQYPAGYPVSLAGYPVG